MTGSTIFWAVYTIGLLVVFWYAWSDMLDEAFDTLDAFVFFLFALSVGVWWPMLALIWCADKVSEKLGEK